EEAWHRFVDLYTPLLYHWAQKMSVPANDISDLIQDVFVHLLKELPIYQMSRRGHFHGWLHTLFKNKALECLRKHQQQPIPCTLNDISNQASLTAAEEEEYRKYLTERVLHILKQSFPETTWRACWESVVTDRPAEQIAQELGITINMVYLAKSRVLRQLRLELMGLLD
ncbi:MAG TPA: sigma-70 family RNA polymerase sigma factor, partial [Gemmatales bacterium]|nr:sigma-70 family RNA polymerase sigma factor [Gemmatales bacterium]